MIDFFLYATSVLVLLAIVSFSIWSVVNTRNVYYNDFMKRKSEREKSMNIKCTHFPLR